MMRQKILQIFIAVLSVSISKPGFSQDRNERGNIPVEILDSLKRNGIVFNEPKKKPEINLTTDQAVRFLQKRLQPQYWKNTGDPLRQSISRLVVEALNEPFDSSESYLHRYPFDSINIPWNKFYVWKPLRLKVPEYDSLSKSVTGLKDTSILVVVDTLRKVSSDYSDFPFTYYNFPYQADSIQAAVRSLLFTLDARDSSIINIAGLGDVTIPVWLNSKSGKMHRYWLKNDLNDSVTIWIGAQSKNTLGIYLEHGVSLARPVRQGYYSDARIEVQEVDKSKLLDVRKIVVKPQFWKYRSEAAFALNQASLTNWVKGGESSISTSLDITGYADYNNKPWKFTSGNFARLKYGLIATRDNGVRKNLDLLETNSKLNHKAFGKFDFSAIMLFKTQLSRGFTYTETEKTLVSKFMNPGIFTIGFGLDYKPNKTTSINFSPLSYKGTFVPDTAKIDQTLYGIAADKRSKNEPGASFMITNEYKPYKTVTVTNRLQLFTNYINNPQNIDVDWEMILTASLNWFTDVRFNTHLIFDDDTKTPVFDKNDEPVIVDGKQKKNARIQFKELLGFSFIFRF